MGPAQQFRATIKALTRCSAMCVDEFPRMGAFKTHPARPKSHSGGALPGEEQAQADFAEEDLSGARLDFAEEDLSEFKRLMLLAPSCSGAWHVD